MKRLFLVLLLLGVLVVSGCLQFKDNVQQSFSEDGKSHVSADVGMGINLEAIQSYYSARDDTENEENKLVTDIINKITYEAMCGYAPSNVKCEPKDGYMTLEFDTDKGYTFEKNTDWISGEETLDIEIRYVPSPLPKISNEELLKKERELAIKKYGEEHFIKIRSGYFNEDKPCTNIKVNDGQIKCSPVAPSGRTYVLYGCTNDMFYSYEKSLSYKEEDGESWGWWNSSAEAADALEEDVEISLIPITNGEIACPRDKDTIYLIGKAKINSTYKYYIKELEVNDKLDDIIGQLSTSSSGSSFSSYLGNNKKGFELNRIDKLIDFENGTVLDVSVEQISSLSSYLKQYGSDISMRYTVKLPEGYKVADVSYGGMNVLYKQDKQDVTIGIKSLFADGAMDMPLEIKATKQLYPPYTPIIVGVAVLGAIAYFVFMRR